MAVTLYSKENFFGTIISVQGYTELGCEDVFCPYEQRICKGEECAAFVHFLDGVGMDEEWGCCGMVWK